MSKIKLTGENSGYVEISAGQNAGNNTLETPTSGTRLVAHEGSQDVTLNANLTVNGVLTYNDVTNIDSVGIVTARSGIHVTGGSVGIGTDNPNHKLTLFQSGTGTFDAINFVTGNTNSSGYQMGVNSSGQVFHWNTTNSSINFATNNTERLRIQSDGKIVTSGGAAVGTLTLAGDGKDITFGRTQNSGTGGVGRLVATGNVVYLQAGQNTSSGSAADLVFGNYGGVGERLRITSDGKFGYGTATPGCFFEVSDDAAGATVQQKLINRNTAANSSTNQFIYVNNSGAGDPFTTWTVGGVTSWSMGIDNSDSDKLKIAAASNLNSNQYLTLDTSGNIGINKTPYTKLDIHNGSDASVIVSIEGADSSSEYLGFGINSGEAVITAGGNGSTSNALVFRTAPSGTETERFRIDSAGRVLIGANSGSSNITLKLQGHSGSSTQDAKIRLCRGSNSPSNGNQLGAIFFSDNSESPSADIIAIRDGGTWSGSSKPGALKFSTTANGATSATERFRIHSTGIPQFTTTGTQYPSASVPAFVVNSNGDHALVLNNQNTTDPRGLFIYQDQDVNNGTSYFLRARAGGTDRAHLYSNGNFNISGGMQASSVNLQNSSTSSWFQTGTSIASYPYVWAAKNSSSNIWHSGLQTDGDLYLGGNLAGTNNIGLIGSTGSGWFSGGLGIGGFHNANTIDEYEEGTWTPVMNKSGVTGTAGTPSTGVGYYRRVGQLLWIAFYWYKSSGGFGNNAQPWYVSGLPFQLAHQSGGAYQFIPGGYNHINGTNYQTQSNRWQSNSINGSATLTMYGPNSATNWTSGYLEFSASGCLMLP